MGEGRNGASRAGCATRDYGEIPPDAVDDIRKLPALAEEPAWQACVADGEVVHVSGPDGLSRSLFPLLGERDAVGLLEVKTVGRMQPRR